MKDFKAEKHSKIVPFLVIILAMAVVFAVLFAFSGRITATHDTDSMAQVNEEKTQEDGANADKAVQKGDGSETNADKTAQTDGKTETDSGSGEPAPDGQQAGSGGQDQPAEQPSDGKRYVYLTFDDGPSRNTEAILDILAQNDIKATFFVTGHTDEKSMMHYRMIADAGHTLAMHSYTHDYHEIYSSAEAFMADYEKISNLIESITGSRPLIYRFPGGSSNTLPYRAVTMTELIDLLAERGVQYFDWNANSTDASGKNPPAATLVKNAAAGLTHDHNILLMHDAAGHESTVEALPQIIQECRNRGLIFATITPDTPPAHHSRRD